MVITSIVPNHTLSPWASTVRSSSSGAKGITPWISAIPITLNHSIRFAKPNHASFSSKYNAHMITTQGKKETSGELIVPHR